MDSLNDVVSVSAGDAFTCALSTTNMVTCWGYNYFGTLGDGTTTNSTSPVLVAGSGLGNATAISAGYGHICALLSTGKVQCWGNGP